MKNKIRLSLFIAWVALFSPLLSLSQEVDKRREMHHETLDDKYLPNAYNNKKTSTPYSFTNGVERRASGTTIFTKQVNVNGSGLNIVGDAANEPNIAVNPVNPNNIVIGWRQFDNVASNFRQAGWSYTFDEGNTWTFPGVIEAGFFRSDPVLDFDTAGNFYYNSLDFNFNCKVFKSINGGTTWGDTVAAHGGDKQWMTIDRTSGVGNGNIYSFWNATYSTCTPGCFTRSTDDDESFENCSVINGNPYWGTMAVGNAGELYIAGTVSSSDNLEVAKSTNAQTPGSTISWNTSGSVYMDGYINADLTINPQGLLGQASIDVDRSNGPGRDNVYVLASLTRLSNSDDGDVMFSKSTNGGTIWNSPKRINDDASTTNMQWLGTMSVAPNGRIDAVWLDTRDGHGSDSSALYYSYSIDQGTTWSANEKMSALFNPHVGYPNQNKMGDYFDMISDNTGAHLAWTNTLNGEEDVYYSHIVPNIIVTAVNGISNAPAFSVYPNPSSGDFVITGNSKPVKVEIYNLLGASVYSSRELTGNTRNEIDISSQPAGVYFLKIFNRDGSSVVKKIARE